MHTHTYYSKLCTEGQGERNNGGRVDLELKGEARRYQAVSVSGIKHLMRKQRNRFARNKKGTGNDLITIWHQLKRSPGGIFLKF